VADAGHCPHDDSPAAVNEALAKWIDGLPAQLTSAAAVGGTNAASQPATLSQVAARLRSAI
jgi:hypothetical protein